jgi:HSP20 family protein
MFPVYPVRRFFGDMERMMDEVLHGWSPKSGPEETTSWAPALDVRETDTDLIVEVEAAGLKPGELDISVENSTLTIRGERKAERVEEKGELRLSEREYGTFCRSVELPVGVQGDKASAKHADGVVTITLPKTEKSKAKKIKVE